MTLDSFGTTLNTAVFGASGGIGRAFVDALAASPAVAQVHAVSRAAATDLPAKAAPHRCDVVDETALETTVRAMVRDAPLDLVIIAIGILHEGTSVLPEKTWRQIDPAAMRRVLEVNTVLPVLVAKHVLPVLTDPAS